MERYNDADYTKRWGKFYENLEILIDIVYNTIYNIKQELIDLGKWEKLVKAILEKNPNLRFEDLYKALVSIGYEPNQQKSGSSHFTFRKEGVPPITIPKHSPIKRIYIEMVSKIVQKYMEDEDE